MPHHNGIRRTRQYAEVTECTHVEPVNEGVNAFFLFSVWQGFLFGNDFDGSIRTGQLTGLATGAAMFVLFVVGHDDLATEPFSHFQVSSVVRVLLGYDFLGVGKIIARKFHAFEQ